MASTTVDSLTPRISLANNSRDYSDHELDLRYGGLLRFCEGVHGENVYLSARRLHCCDLKGSRGK